MYRIRARCAGWAIALMATSSCAAASETAKPSRDGTGALSTLHARQAQQAARLEELEARISLLEAEARKLRGGQEREQRSEESVRIGGAREPVALSPDPDEDELKDGSAGQRTQLRLYGRNAGSSRAELPSVPVVSETLPVAPLPSQRAASEQLRAGSAAREAASREAELEHYREGLRCLRERRFEAAVAAFDAFIAQEPRQPLVPNALYWRGEAHYAQRQYAQARDEFEDVLARYPRSEKAADALLKLALCFRQLGSEEQARSAFRRLRTEYPNSQAATIAAREGAT